MTFFARSWPMTYSSSIALIRCGGGMSLMENSFVFFFSSFFFTRCRFGIWLESPERSNMPIFGMLFILFIISLIWPGFWFMVSKLFCMQSGQTEMLLGRSMSFPVTLSGLWQIKQNFSYPSSFLSSTCTSLSSTFSISFSFLLFSFSDMLHPFYIQCRIQYPGIIPYSSICRNSSSVRMGTPSSFAFLFLEDVEAASLLMR